MASEKELVKYLTTIFKSDRWKTVSGCFFREVNADTLTYFNFFTKGRLFRAQFGVSSRPLNRVAWNLYGIPETFGTDKDHLINSSRCMLSVAYNAEEFEQDSNPEMIASRVMEFCLQNGQRFSSVVKIDDEIKSLSIEKQKQYNNDRICIAIALHQNFKAKEIISFEKREHISYELSIFSHAERVLQAEM